ncbi:unnamed protein product [Clavelina lepadiformis]|uniref:Fibrinogen C-terminal domain-containing protein n=1 Tax=Clavelina lepadiformis TaxID=159417 RepID=A0ABP0GM53_CLALP
MMSTLQFAVIYFLFFTATQGTRQVTLTCADDDNLGERGLPGAPGKKGPVGTPGDRGVKGDMGDKGEPGASDTWMQEFQKLQTRITDLEDQLTNKIDQQIINLTRVSGDCQDLFERGMTTSGVKSVVINGKVREVYCDMETENGGWLVFHRRFDGSENFYRNWEDYQRGFGEVDSEYWLGLNDLHQLTKNGNYRLRVDIEDFENNRAFAEYSSFEVGSEDSNYRLTATGYSGNAGDALQHHNGLPFSTKDRDLDRHEVHCARNYEGAWWYNRCHAANLNGPYLTGGQDNSKGMCWYPWKGNYYSMKKAEMKIKPN